MSQTEQKSDQIKIPKLKVKGKGTFVPPPGWQLINGEWVPSEPVSTSSPTAQGDLVSAD